MGLGDDTGCERHSFTPARAVSPRIERPVRPMGWFLHMMGQPRPRLPNGSARQTTSRAPRENRVILSPPPKNLGGANGRGLRPRCIVPQHDSATQSRYSGRHESRSLLEGEAYFAPRLITVSPL